MVGKIGRLIASASVWRAAQGAALAAGLAGASVLCSKEIAGVLATGGVSPVSPVLLGVVLGILWRHFVGVSEHAQLGVQWMLGSLLRIGIALVGLRLTLPGLAQVGVIAAPVVVACIITALTVSSVLGRIFGLTPGLRRLLAVGTAVCGCTAIIATAPAIRARALETGTALACVVLLGSVGMLCYPWLASVVFQKQALAIGVFLGSAIHDTSQVVGASVIAAQQLSAPEIVAFASATKLLRNLSIIVLVPALAWLTHRDSLEHGSQIAVGRERVLPMFVIGFIALVVLRALGDSLVVDSEAWKNLWLTAMAAAKTLSELLMLGGMTALGLSISLAQFNEVGVRPVLVALIVAVATAACSLGVTYALLHALG